MTNINVSYKNAGKHGIPDFQVMDTYVDSNLVADATPPIKRPVRILLADSLALPQFAVLGLTAGKLVWASYNATLGSAIKPIGVLLQAATSGANNATIYGEVALGGSFNAGSNDAGDDSPLVWDASFTTLAEKTTWEGVVGNPNLIFRSRLGANAT